MSRKYLMRSKKPPNLNEPNLEGALLSGLKYLFKLNYKMFAVNRKKASPPWCRLVGTLFV
ncbi:hypothetical protein DWY22_13800 [Heyndrickxia coagulans]|nr:hypothetical protein DWY22_13800 [Heyndrickxia coagulans]